MSFEPRLEIAKVRIWPGLETRLIYVLLQGDTTIGSIKIAEMMSGTGVTVRTGYPGQKSSVKKQVKVKPIRQENGTKETFVKKFTPSSVPFQPPEVKSAKKESRPNVFVPRQLRQHMK